MSYAVQFVLSFLEAKVGSRAAKQVIYVLLLAFGVRREVMRDVFGASDTTLCKYSKAMKERRLAEVFEQECHHRPRSELEAHREKIVAEFDKKPPSNRL